jgi:galactose mutarotase-like enzyme
MRTLNLDRRGIPTGEEAPFGGFDAELGELDFDDGFALMEEKALFSITGADRRIGIELLGGYRYAQVFAPKDQSYIALEPMTAPTSALTTGRGLRVVEPGGRFQAIFRISIDAFQGR